MEAQAWDAECNEGCRIHPHLTADSINVDKASKMRNAHAFHALDRNMLNLMKVYMFWYFLLEYMNI